MAAQQQEGRTCRTCGRQIQPALAGSSLAQTLGVLLGGLVWGGKGVAAAALDTCTLNVNTCKAAALDISCRQADPASAALLRAL